MCTCITLVLACEQAHLQSRSQRPQPFCTVMRMPLPLDKSNGGSGDEIGSLHKGQQDDVTCQKHGVIWVCQMNESWSCFWSRFSEMAILPHLSRCYYIVRSRCYTGSNRSKEKGKRVKDRRKNGASKRAGLALVPFFARPKPKNSFLGLSLLQNHTEMLATQDKSLWSLWLFNPWSRYCRCGPCGRGSCGHCGPCVNVTVMALMVTRVNTFLVILVVVVVLAVIMVCVVVKVVVVANLPNTCGIVIPVVLVIVRILVVLMGFVLVIVIMVVEVILVAVILVIVVVKVVMIVGVANVAGAVMVNLVVDRDLTGMITLALRNRLFCPKVDSFEVVSPRCKSICPMFICHSLSLKKWLIVNDSACTCRSTTFSSENFTQILCTVSFSISNVIIDIDNIVQLAIAAIESKLN